MGGEQGWYGRKTGKGDRLVEEEDWHWSRGLVSPYARFSPNWPSGLILLLAMSVCLSVCLSLYLCVNAIAKLLLLDWWRSNNFLIKNS